MEVMVTATLTPGARGAAIGRTGGRGRAIAGRGAEGTVQSMQLSKYEGKGDEM